MSRREALWKTGKWSKTYILSISGSLKAVQDLTNSKLTRKSRMPAGKVPTVTLFSKVLPGNYWHLERLSSIEAPLYGRFFDKSGFGLSLVWFLDPAAETFYVECN